MNLNTISKYIILILIVTFVFGSSTFASIQLPNELKANDIISKVIRTYGGAKTINNINTVYARGKITAFMRGDEGTYTRYFKRNKKLRVETIYNRSAETRILNGEKGWRGTNNNPPSKVTGIRYAAMAYQYKQLDLPYGLLKKTFVVNHMKEAHYNNKTVYVIELIDKEGPPLRVYIDPDSFYIIKVEGLLSIGTASAILSVELSDFKIIHGIPFPHKITNLASGHKAGETVIEEYSINTPMNDSLFSPQ